LLKLNSELLDSWNFFKNNLVAISVIVLPIIIPLEIGTAIYIHNFTSDGYSIIIPILIGLLLYPVYIVGTIFYISSVISGEPIDRNVAWKFGVKYWLPYMSLTLLLVIASMIIFTASVLIAVGISILFGLVTLSRLMMSMSIGAPLSEMGSLSGIDPLFTIVGLLIGIFILFIFVLGTVPIIRWGAFSGFDLLFNESTPAGALKHSWKFTRDCIWRLLFGYTIIFLILNVPSYLLFYLFDSSRILYEFIYTIVNLVLSVFFVLYIIFSFRVYVQEINKT